MSNVNEIRTSVSSARSQLEEAKKRAEKSRQELLQQKNKLPDIRGEQSLRERFLGLKGRDVRRQVMGTEAQIEGIIGQVEKYEEETLKPFQSQIESAEGQLREYDKQQYALKLAEKVRYGEAPVFALQWATYNGENISALARKYYRMMPSQLQQFSDQVDKIQSELPSGEKLIVDWDKKKILGVDSKALQQSLPVIDGQIRFASPSVSAPKFDVISPTGLKDIPRGQINIAPSLPSRLKTEFSSRFAESGNIVSATLGTASSYFKSLQDKEAQRTKDYYQQEGIQNIIGLGTEVAPYFTPAGSYLIASGAMSKLASYTFKPEILERQATKIQSMFPSLTDKQAKLGVVGLTLGEGAIGLAGIKLQTRASELAKEISKSKPTQEFIAVVDKVDDSLSVNVIGQTKGKGVPDNIFISKQNVIKVNEKPFSTGITYKFDKVDDIVSATGSRQFGTFADSSKGFTGIRRGEFIIGKDTTQAVKTITGSQDIVGLRYDISKFNFIDDVIGKKVGVSNKWVRSDTIGVLYPRATTIDGLKLTQSVPDEFVFLGSSSPRLRIYRTGETSLVGQRDIKGLIKFKDVDKIDDAFKSQIFKPNVKTGRLELKEEFVSEIVKTLPPKTAKIIPDTPKTSTGGITQIFKTETFPTIVGGTGKQSEFTGRGGLVFELESSPNMLLRPDTKVQTEIRTMALPDSRIQIKQLELFAQPQKILESEKVLQLDKVLQQDKILQNQKIMQEQKILQAQKVLQLSKVLQAEKVLQAQKSIGILKSTTKPRQREALPKKIIPFSLGDSSVRGLINRVKSEPSFFEAFGRRKGKDISLGKFRGQEEAERKLKGFLTGTLGASGKIKADGRELDVKALSISRSPMFRESKADRTRIVQKREFRLGTFGEKSEIKKAKRGFFR
jgi:hypothetical protein